MNCRAISVNHVHCNSDSLHSHHTFTSHCLYYPHWYVAVIHLPSFCLLHNSVWRFYTCMHCCYCNAVFIGLISAYGVRLNSLRCLLPTPEKSAGVRMNSKHINWCAPLAQCGTSMSGVTPRDKCWSHQQDARARVTVLAPPSWVRRFNACCSVPLSPSLPHKLSATAFDYHTVASYALCCMVLCKCCQPLTVSIAD